MRLILDLLQSLFGRRRSQNHEPNRIEHTSPFDLPSTERPSARTSITVVATTIKVEPIHQPPQRLVGPCYVVDGDTIVIKGQNIRLAGIDAPELDHPWGNKAKWALVKLCKGQIIEAELSGDLSYNRVVATCRLSDGRDLSAEMVKLGLALDWAKHSNGRYRHLEPPDARKRLWRGDARQKGRLHVSSQN